MVDVMEKPKAPEKTEKQPNKALRPRLVLESGTDYMNSAYTMKVEEKFEECLAPEYWANVAHFYAPDPGNHRPSRVGSIIEIRRDDHAFYAKLYIRNATQNTLLVEVTHDGYPKYFGKDVKQTVEGYKRKWDVGKRGFNVIRLSDGAIVGKAEDIRTKEDAVAFINKMG